MENSPSWTSTWSGNAAGLPVLGIRHEIRSDEQEMCVELVEFGIFCARSRDKIRNFLLWLLVAHFFFHLQVKRVRSSLGNSCVYNYFAKQKIKLNFLQVDFKNILEEIIYNEKL